MFNRKILCKLKLYFESRGDRLFDFCIELSLLAGVQHIGFQLSLRSLCEIVLFQFIDQFKGEQLRAAVGDLLQDPDKLTYKLNRFPAVAADPAGSVHGYIAITDPPHLIINLNLADQPVYICTVA